MAAHHDFKKLDALRQQLRGGAGPVREGLHQAGRIYMGRMAERFVNNSRGGGDWAPLAKSTLRARARAPQRRKAAKVREDLAANKITVVEAKSKLAKIRKSKTKAPRTAAVATAVLAQAGVAARPAILRDTGTLFGAMQAGHAGNVFEDIPGGVRVGIGGPAPHPGGSTIADIARYHQLGTTRMKARPIMVQPTGKLHQEMSEAYTNGVKRAIDAMK